MELDANAVLKAAQKISGCDFRVTLQRQVTDIYQWCHPWTITVAERGWERTLVVENVSVDGDDATFGLLSTPGPGLECEITLQKLIAGGYAGAKKILRPS